MAYAQDLVIRVIVYGILGYHNDGLLTVFDDRSESVYFYCNNLSHNISYGGVCNKWS